MFFHSKLFAIGHLVTENLVKSIENSHQIAISSIFPWQPISWPTMTMDEFICIKWIRMWLVSFKWCLNKKITQIQKDDGISHLCCVFHQKKLHLQIQKPWRFSTSGRSSSLGYHEDRPNGIFQKENFRCFIYRTVAWAHLLRWFPNWNGDARWCPPIINGLYSH